jgi:hypothetical protein
MSIVPHHCGDHSLCKHEQFCTYVAVKNAHPEWTVQQVKEEAAQRTHRFKGKNMALSAVGQQKLIDIIFSRFNENNIDRIAECGCSNSCEGFWGTVTKYSNGKRINGTGTDLGSRCWNFVFATIMVAKNRSVQEKICRGCSI